MESEKKMKALSEMSAEELCGIVKEQSTEIGRLRAYVQQVSGNMMMKRLDYLFKVLDSSAAFDDEVVELASSEIIELMWPIEEGEEEGESEVTEGEDG